MHLESRRMLYFPPSTFSLGRKSNNDRGPKSIMYRPYVILCRLQHYDPQPHAFIDKTSLPRAG